jgi:large subunit ribosomal protein L6
MSRVGLINEKIEIPAGITVTYKDGILTVKGKAGTLTRKLSHPRVKIVLAGKEFHISCEEPKRREAAVAGTMMSHILNMFHGAAQPYEYKMKIVYSHFPIKTAIKGNFFHVENFLGEKAPRKAKILADTKIVVKGDEVILTGPNVENVSQTAANIEKATRIKDRDLRIFQDGVFITQKGSR